MPKRLQHSNSASCPLDMTTKVEVPSEEVNNKPWKYLGYEEYSSFISSDDDFFVVRRFSTLTARVILALQDQLSELEEELAILEKSLKRFDSPAVHNGSFREETKVERAGLLMRINKRLREYSEIRFPYFDRVMRTDQGF